MSKTSGSKRKFNEWILLLLLITLCYAMPHMEGLFHALFPQIHRPVYTQTSFINLLLSHVFLVSVSSLISIIIGVSIGLFVTRPYGKNFRSLVETLVAICQTFPPVAVLSIAAPLIGMGAYPAIIALILYGISPIVQSTIAAISSIDKVVLEVARGVGMTAKSRLLLVELPIAMPTILAGIRISVSINIGTAAIASTVGATTLGTPIIIGLTGFNMAYVLQGALLVTLLAITVDLLFERLQQYINR